MRFIGDTFFVAGYTRQMANPATRTYRRAAICDGDCDSDGRRVEAVLCRNATIPI